jgi:hypothetical protein
MKFIKITQIYDIKSLGNDTWDGKEQTIAILVENIIEMLECTTNHKIKTFICVDYKNEIIPVKETMDEIIKLIEEITTPCILKELN